MYKRKRKAFRASFTISFDPVIIQHGSGEGRIIFDCNCLVLICLNLIINGRIGGLKIKKGIE